MSFFAAPSVKLRMNWFEVFNESKPARFCTAGPKTRGGMMVATVKLGDCSLMKSQAAFSANVLLAVIHSQGSRVSDKRLLKVVAYQSSLHQHFQAPAPW